MRRVLAIALLLLLYTSTALAYTPQEGDLIFQTSHSRQSLAIQKATHSRYSHVGMILFRNGQPYVYEAIGPVQYTPLKAWIARGSGGRFVALRPLRPLSKSQLATLHRQAQRYLGKPYDFSFEWSDKRMYCSELVWKMYHAAGVDLAPLRHLGSFDLRDPMVKQILQQRYGDHVPLNEPVISPAALLDSPLLGKVSDHSGQATASTQLR